MNFQFDLATLFRLYSRYDNANQSGNLPLNAAFEYFQITNPGGGNPYHNNLHTEWAILDFVKYYLYENFTPWQIQRHHILAVMYHDFGHSAGEKSDKENVAFAISTIEKKFSEGLNEKAIKTMTDLVMRTEFSNGFVHAPETIQDKAMRHADLSTIFHVFDQPKETVAQLRGLATECGLDFDMEFLRKNAEFLMANDHYLHEAIRPKLSQAIDRLYNVSRSEVSL